MRRRASGAVSSRVRARTDGAGLPGGRPPVISSDPRSLTPAEIAALAKISHIAGSPVTTPELLKGVSNILRRLVPFDRMAVMIIRPATDMIDTVYQAGIPIAGSPEGFATDSHGSIASHVMRTRAPWVNTNVDATVIDEFPKARPSVEGGIRSWISVPLVSDEYCIGILQVQSLRPGAYGQRHVELVRSVARHIVGALYGHLTVERLQIETRIARELSEERATLAELGQMIHSSPDLEEAYRPFAEKLRHLVPYDGIGVITLPHDGSGTWRMRLDHGMTLPEDRALQAGIDGDGSLTTHVMKLRRPHLLSLETPENVSDALARFPVMKPWVDAGLKCILSAPLIIRDTAVGVLHLRSLRPHAYSERHIALIEQVAIYVASAVNNAALADRQTEQAELRASVAELGNTVISSLNLQDVYLRFTAMLQKTVPWDRVTVNSVRPGATAYREQYAAGIPVKGRQPGDLVQVAGTMSELVLNEDRSVMIDLASGAEAVAELERLPGLRPEIEQGFRAFLSTPLRSNQGVIGTFNVRSLRAGTYTAEHIPLIEQVAIHLATAMTNADLHARLAKESEEKTHIAHLGRVLSSSAHIADVLPEFFEAVKLLLPTDRLVITVTNPDTGVSEDKHTIGRHVPGWDDRREPGVVGPGARKAIATGRGVMLTTAEIAAADPTLYPGIAAGYAVGLKSAILAPLISGGRVIGSINLKSEREDAYTSSDLDLLERIAIQVAGSVQVAESFEKVVAAASDRELRVRAEAETENLAREAQEKSRFITQVGHELRTPLTTVLAFADILRRNRDHNLNTGQLEKLAVMQRNGRRLAVLIDDLLDLSRIEQGSYVLISEKMDAVEFIRKTVKDLRPALAAQKQRLAVKAGRKPLCIYADQQRLAQVVSALVTNASSYSPEGSTITLSVVESGGRVEIAVADQGIGISPDEQGRIFKLFYRVDNEKTRSVAGTGIGLYVAKTLVEAHGGTISVDPAYSGGARFVVSLPQHSEAAGTQAA